MSGKRRIRLIATISVLTIAMWSDYVALSQARSAPPATPVALVPGDLAALTLRPADLEEPGWEHEGAFFETMDGQARAQADYRGSVITTEDVVARLMDLGWSRQYVHLLSQGSGGGAATPVGRIRSYITAYESPQGARAGFAYLEDESAVPTARDLSTSRDFGDEFELTRDRGSLSAGRLYTSLDLTFRAGTLVAGVSLVRYGDAAEEERESDQELIERLAAILESRVASPVPSGATIGTQVLRLPSDGLDVVTFDDAYYRLESEDLSLSGESAAGAQLRIETYAGATDVYQLWQGIETSSATGALFGVTLLRFEDETQAESWVTELESILAVNPFYGDLQYETGAGGQELGDESVALSYIAGGGSAGAPRALLIAVRVGATVARIHLVPQGNLPSIESEPVVALAEAQVTCLHGDSCHEMVAIPTAVFDSLDDTLAPNASPAATPMGQ